MEKNFTLIQKRLKSNRRIVVYLALFITILLWGSSFVEIKVALKNFDPVILSIYRYIVASATLFVLAIFQKIQRLAWKDIPRFVFLGLIGVSLYNIALNYGEQTVTAGATSFIINTIPIFTTILAFLFLNEPVSTRLYLGIMVSFVGIGIISFAESDDFQLNIGVLILLLAAFAQSIFFIGQKPLFNRYSPLTIMCYATWLGTLLLLPLGTQLLTQLERADYHAHFSVIYLGIFPAALGYLTWSYVLSNIQASKATSFLYLVPLVVIILGIFIIKEYPEVLTVIGGFLALIGVIIGNAKK